MAMTRTLCILIALVAGVSADVQQRGEAENAGNPIRKVVTMLQAMQKKISEEGEKEQELYDKYMCYCKSAGGDLEASVSSADSKIPEVESSIKEGEAKKAQLEEDLKQAQADRAAAKEAMAEATGIRGKAAAAFAAEKAEADTNIAALSKAVAAVERGMSGGFLQTPAAQVIRQLATAKAEMLDGDRQELLAFLSGGQDAGYAPQGGQITGILKGINDDMKKSLAEATAEENEDVKSYGALMAAKKKEVSALTHAIETKTVRSGQLAVEIVQMKNDLTDTQEALLEDKKFLADLSAGCGTKEKEWDEIKATRAQELVALAETIKVLNDDDALELFKKTLPSASSSLLQMEGKTAAVRARALALLRAAQQKYPGLDFITLALHGSKIGFGKVIAMIDKMVANLKQEQTDDDNKKEYCGVQLDAADDRKKGLERSIADSETAIEEAEGNIGTLKDELKALEAGIKDLDKSVAEATAQRKAEHESFTELMASDSAAKELLNFAKNRLNKFYNPKIYKAPPKRELSEEDRITVANGGTLAPTAAPGGIAGTGVAVLAQVSVHRHTSKDAPPPAPDAPGAYQKKGEESGGVIGMIDLLVKDLDKEMTVAETEEEDGQKDYEQTMSDSAAKRAADSKSLTEKTAAKASTESDLESEKEAKASSGKELMATSQVISGLHNECDWLMQYFDVRQEARAGEIDALGKAKAVLSGADFALLQKGTRSLRGQA